MAAATAMKDNGRQSAKRDGRDKNTSIRDCNESAVHRRKRIRPDGLFDDVIDVSHLRSNTRVSRGGLNQWRRRQTLAGTAVENHQSAAVRRKMKSAGSEKIRSDWSEI